MNRNDDRGSGPRTPPPPSTGEPLPAPLRTRMEAFWGQDLSDVRLHLRPELLTLGAAALAMGSDICFVPGRCDPSSRRGLEELGHELAHVLQQRAGRVRPAPGSRGAIIHDAALEAEADRLGAHAAAFVLRGPDGLDAPPRPRSLERAAPASPRVAQCMPFGVELECSQLAIKEAPATAKKGTIITQDRRTFKAVFEVTSSKERVVEFVTLHPASTKAELEDALGNMTAQAYLWDQAMEANTGLLTPSSQHKTVAWEEDEKTKWAIHKQAPIEGMLQITIGVPLRGVPLMYRKFQSGDQHTHERSLRLWERLRRGARSGRGMDPDGRPLSKVHEDTWGFLLLVIDYLNRANSPYGKPYAKAQFDTLARTDFATIFGTLPVAEQDRMAPQDGKGERTMREEWVQWLVTQVLSKEDLKKKPPKQMLPWMKETNRRPTFHEWLRNMPHKDLFTEKQSSHFLGLGALGNKVDTVEILGQKEPAPIFELRAPLGAGTPYREWVERVSGFWDLYQQLLIPRRAQRQLNQPPVVPLRQSAQAIAAAIRARPDQELRARAEELRARIEEKERSRSEPGHRAEARDEKASSLPVPLPLPKGVPFERVPSQREAAPVSPAPFVRTNYPTKKPRSYYDAKDGK